jgi:hypothetical protein
MAGQPSRFAIWSSTFVCRDGERVPAPPEQLGGFRKFMAQWLRPESWWGLVALVAVGLTATAMQGGRLGWSAALYVGGGIILVVALLAILPLLTLLIILPVSMAFWPWTRVQGGEAARKETMSKPLDALDAEIGDCEVEMRDAPLDKRWQYQRRVDWLRRKREQRMSAMAR